MSTPLPQLTLPAEPREAREGGAHVAHADHSPSGFSWPTPPYAIYPTSVTQDGPEPCEIEGLNGKVMKGQLIAFSPERGAVLVLIPPSRQPMPLRLNQFRQITLTQPVRPTFMDRGAIPPDLMDFHPTVNYRVDLHEGGSFSGRTVGHVELPEGMFLFPPVDTEGGVMRLFCSRDVYSRVQVGDSIGNVLVADETANPVQIAEALEAQQHLRQQRLGDVLLNNNVLSRDQLEAALAAQSRMPMVRIGEALVTLGYVSPAQLESALAEQKTNRAVPLGEILVRSGQIERSALRSALARKMGYPVVDLEQYPVDAAALRLIPLAAARRLQSLPLQQLPGRLVVAMEDPSRHDIVDELAFLSQCKIVPVLADADDLTEAIHSTYRRLGLDGSGVLPSLEPADLQLDDTSADRLLADLEMARGEPLESDEPIVEQSDNALVRLINSMIVEAHAEGVSDIHIEPQPGREKLRIRFRRDGVLKPYIDLPYTYRNALVARLKIMCDLDISERRRPQDGKINFAKFVPNCPIELRVATIPTNNGLEDVVLRLLASARALPLDQLGLSSANLLALKEAISRPYGLVLCVGPTGSGKTTTLHSALSDLNTTDRKIWTAEDPVEITQPGLRQVQVNPKIDWTFAKALRAFLRADPDVIMVGEIRDEETASIAIESALTGHLVLSTLHTNSAAETITRLLDMGLDPFNFADSLLAVLAQRLVRRLCPDCRVTEPAPSEWVEELLSDYLAAWGNSEAAPGRDAIRAEWLTLQGSGAQGNLVRYRSIGCERCANTGLKGRAAIHELLISSREMRHTIHSTRRADAIETLALHEGMRTLRQDGIYKVLNGITTLEEVRANSNSR